MAEYRVEHDSMGEVRVPAHVRWAAQTQRAVQNFPISGQPVDEALIRALAELKRAAAVANAQVGAIDREVGEALREAAERVMSGELADHFPVDVFQTGSGTSTNMNMNEVLASLASERLGRAIRPNDEPNASQSSNDMFPSAIHLAAVRMISEDLLPALDRLAGALRQKASEFEDVVKSGRTHLMDATPVTLGQEFGGYARMVELGAERVRSCLPRLSELPLGGSAVGTGLNVPDGYTERAYEALNEHHEAKVTEARDHFEAQGSRDAAVEASGMLRTVAVSLYKIANDLRWMGSGPRTGLAELRLPDLQPGSSIMPAKVNPVIPEAVCQVAAQVVGNDAAVAFGGSAGAFELNVMLPVIGRNLLESVRLLASVSDVLVDKCLEGLEADEERCRRYAESSPAIATALNPYLGYEEVARIVKQAMEEEKTLREVVLERGTLSEEEVDEALAVRAMAEGGLLGRRGEAKG